jgi:RNA polymerase sigma-70 factor (ECF subfamily)
MIPDRIIDLTDIGLFQLVKKNDQIAFKEIYKRYWSKLYIYSFNILKEKDLCEDIIQEIFSDLWIRRNEIEISNLQSYLYQSVRNQIYKHFRSTRYKEELLNQLNIFLNNPTVAELYDSQEFQSFVNNSISKLPEQRRMIFQLSRDEELSNKEISKKLNISVQTVKNQISKSLQFLRKSLKNLNTILF